MSADDADDADESTINQLQERVDELEKRVYPNRRQVVQSVGVLGLLGIAGGTGYGVGRSRASDDSVGHIGASGSSQDIFLDEIKDPGGDLVADLDDAGDLSFKNSRGISNLGNVGTDDLNVTNETLVDVVMSSNQSISSGSFATLNLDSENKDELGEFNTSNHQFTPSSGGWFLVSFAVDFKGGNSGDRLDVKFRDVDGSTDLIYIFGAKESNADMTVVASRLVNLTGGNAHEVIVKDNDSNSEISSSDERTYLTIRSAYR